jgi:Relaxase/Mobilisation nuclease domain
MIVKILSNGKSFNGLATYLSHDPDHAKTAERVAWAHTLNCANDDVPCAVNEMVWTARDAELLKQEAGIRAGGRKTENTVKHFSLNWAPGERPTKEHMTETTQDFLRHMKWQEHQAILIAHNDKDYSHVHCMLNAVHPETGLRLDDNFERRRAQEWALQYEREHGIYCEQRLLPNEERERNPPRNIWMQFWVNQREFEKSEKSLENNAPIFADDPQNRRNSEWQILRQIQRDERIEFFAQGKSEFIDLRKSIFREVREAFRDSWSEYYAGLKAGRPPEEMGEFKQKIIAEQEALLQAKGDEACKELRQCRDIQYRTLLDDQREERATLRERQAGGRDNASFLERLANGRDGENEMTLNFRDTAEEVGMPKVQLPELAAARSDQEDAETRSGPDDDAGMRNNFRHGLTSFFSSLAFDLINLGTGYVPAPPRTDSSGRRFIDIAAEEVTKLRLQHDRTEEDEKWRQRQRERVPDGD